MSPTYALYGPREAVPPPFYSLGGHFLCLVLAADQGKIDALIETMLNGPAAGEVVYESLGHWAVLQIGSFDQLGSRAPGYANQGTAAETQMSIWLPVRARPRGGGEHLCLTAPHVYVDTPMSLVSGREDFGYPKGLGRFTPERWSGAGISLTVFGGNYGIARHAAWTQLLSLSTVEPVGALASVTGTAAAPAPADAMSVATELTRRAGYPVDDTALAATGPPPSAIVIVREVIEMIKGNARQVFLKQFRDGQGGSGACYQGVMEAPAKVLNPTIGLSPHEWEVSFTALGSHPIVGELGVSSGRTNLAFEIAMDIELDPATIVAP